MIEGLLTTWEFWIILGIGLVILNLTVGLEFFSLAFGIGGLLTALLMYLSVPEPLIEWLPLKTWDEIIPTFAIMSLAILPLIRRFVYRRDVDRNDVNDY